MLVVDRFALHQMQEYTYAAPGCPVRVCCSRQCTERRSGLNFVQVRLQNLSDRFICNVFLTIEAFGAEGECLYELRRVVQPDCNAEAGAIFGEERLIALGGPVAASLLITVESVVFDDGMLWRKDTIYCPGKQETAAPTQLSASEEPTEAQCEEPIDIRSEEPSPMIETLDPRIAQIISEPIERRIERIMGQMADTRPEQRSSMPPETRSELSALQDPELSAMQDPELEPPATKKRSYALWIWLLVILGLVLVATAVYLLHTSGNYSVF